MTGVVAASLPSCTKNSNTESLSGQVAAHVGTQVVTTLEIETDMRAENVPIAKRKDPAVIRHALNELILRKYLVQQAVAEKLDREPDVLLAVLRSREQTLANTVIARKAANMPVNKSDTDRYIAANPGEFAERKMLTIEQIRFALGPATRGLSEANKTMKTLDDVEQQLNALGVEHTRSVSLLSRSEVPQSLVALLDARKPDEVFYARSGPNGIYIRVRDEQLNPLEGEAATALALERVKALNYKAQLQAALAAAGRETKFEGDYATLMKSAPAPTATTAPTATATATAATASP
jgi:EpsD family peptidyl-prolyl cis-trans isomerase